jgi:CBS domain-containing protein
MHVAAILKEKGRKVETVAPDATVMDAAERLLEKHIGALVVLADGGGVAGIVSERDVIRLIGRHGVAALDWSVGEAMTTAVVPCRESDTVDHVMAMMTEHRFRHLPLIERGALVGIVSIGDVVKHRVAEVESEATALRDYVTAG